MKKLLFFCLMVFPLVAVQPASEEDDYCEEGTCLGGSSGNWGA